MVPWAAPSKTAIPKPGKRTEDYREREHGLSEISGHTNHLVDEAEIRRVVDGIDLRDRMVG